MNIILQNADQLIDGAMGYLRGGIESSGAKDYLNQGLDFLGRTAGNVNDAMEYARQGVSTDINTTHGLQLK